MLVFVVAGTHMDEWIVPTSAPIAVSRHHTPDSSGGNESQVASDCVASGVGGLGSSIRMLPESS